MLLCVSFSLFSCVEPPNCTAVFSTVLICIRFECSPQLRTWRIVCNVGSRVLNAMHPPLAPSTTLGSPRAHSNNTGPRPITDHECCHLIAAAVLQQHNCTHHTRSKATRNLTLQLIPTYASNYPQSSCLRCRASQCNRTANRLHLYSAHAHTHTLQLKATRRPPSTHLPFRSPLPMNTPPENELHTSILVCPFLPPSFFSRTLFLCDSAARSYSQ